MMDDVVVVDVAFRDDDNESSRCRMSVDDNDVDDDRSRQC